MINFSTKNEGTWFDFDPADPNLGSICVRGLSLNESSKIDKMCTKVRRKFKRGNPIEVKEVDETLKLKLTFDYCIVAWKNVSVDGKQAECNIQNKTKLLDSADFVKLVADYIDEMNDRNQALEEAREKNSETTSNGESQK